MSPIPGDAPWYPQGTRLRITNQYARGGQTPVPLGGEWELVRIYELRDKKPYLVTNVGSSDLSHKFLYRVGAVEPIPGPVTDEDMAYVRQSLGIKQSMKEIG
jgi:hypothetical protein